MSNIPEILTFFLSEVEFSLVLCTKAQSNRIRRKVHKFHKFFGFDLLFESLTFWIKKSTYSFKCRCFVDDRTVQSSKTVEIPSKSGKFDELYSLWHCRLIFI